MSEGDQLREEMLRANGSGSHGISNDDRQALRRILERDRRRVRWMKLLTAIAWVVLLGVWHFAAFAAAFGGSGNAMALLLLGIPIFYVAVVISAIYGTRVFMLKDREHQTQLTDFEGRMKKMQDQITRLAERTQPPS